MRYKRGSANGIDLNAISGKSVELWAEFEEQAGRLRDEAREIIETMPGNFHFGSRFSNNRTVASRAISGIVNAGLSFGPSLSADEMDEFIIAAFIDAAGADHWYAYEKDYGTRDE